MKNTYTFKRFFTFGLGMGKTASATSGFTGSVTSFVKDRWAATGWRFVAGGVGGGLAVFSLYLAAAIATGNAHAQTTLGTTGSNTTVQGAAISLNSTYLNVTTPGAVTVTTPNLQLTGSEKISGNLTVQGYTTLSGPNTTIGAGSSTTNLNGYNTTINSTYTTVSSSQTFITGSKVELGANGATVNVKGQTTNLNAVDTKITGNLNASGPVSLAGGSITNPSFSSGSVAMGAGAVVGNGVQNAIQIGAGSNTTANSVNIGNSAVATSVGGALTVQGAASLHNGLNMSGTSITGVKADWTVGNSAVNVNQLTAVRDNLTTSVDNRFGDLTTASSADVHSNGVAGAEQSITTGTGSVAQQLNSVVSSTATTINSTNVRVTTVEGKTQNITASAGETNVAGNLSVSGSTKTNGIDNSGQKITNLTAGTDNTDAVNVSQLNAVAATSAAATNQVQTNLNATNVRVTTVEGKVVDLRTDLTNETQARIDGDSATLNSANNYTNQQVQAQSGADRAYTDKQVGTERDRAMAAEAAISKEVRQVGAMAMAAAAVGAATPVGDKTTAVSVAVGGYSGETAVAIGVTHMVKPTTRIFGSISSVSRGKTGVAIGASFSF